MSFKSHWIVHSENMWEWPHVSDHVTKGTEYINNFIYVYMLFFLFAYGQLGADLKKNPRKNITLWLFYHMVCNNQYPSAD